MHNLFYVENGLSFAIIQQFIKEQNINKNKIIILLGRNLENNTEYKSYDLTYLDFKTSVFFLKGWKKTIFVKHEINKIISENKIQQFKFYTSSISKLSTYFLRNHKINVGLTLVEEGRSAFFSENEFRKYINKLHYSNFRYFFYQVKSFFNYLFLHYPNPNNTISFLKKNNSVLVYGNNSYSYVKNRILVKNPFKKNNLSFDNIECVMSFSYPVEDNLITLDRYCIVLEQTFEYLISKNCITKIHYKFHPQQFAYPENIVQYKKVINKFLKRIEFIELEKNTILEIILANSNAILLSDYSSIMIYSSNFGNKIINNYHLIEKYKNENKQLPILPFVLNEIIERTKIKS